MWHFIAALVAWFLPARGRRRAEAPQPAQRVRTSLPAYRSPRPAEVIDADDLPLVPRYLVAFELRREQQAQRERRTATVLATMGIDYTPEAAA
ncbi:hypothetical protein ABZZ36_35275 [Actinacidiphila glaucinigra]|uniref:hypothetical protein n=1 Tax=Actinacidiphila glaucinigra TaxID=235986 RepID=UPI0033A22C50